MSLVGYLGARRLASKLKELRTVNSTSYSFYKSAEYASYFVSSYTYVVQTYSTVVDYRTSSM